MTREELRARLDRKPPPPVASQREVERVADPGCNLHDNCAEAQRKAHAAGRGWIDHCRSDDCEECFGK